MKKEQNTIQEKKPQKTKLKMTFAILFLAVLFIVELYLMMNYAKEYLFLGIAGLGILCLVYIVTDLAFKMRKEREEIFETEYEKIYKAQKVSYVFLKQSIAGMETALERITANTEVPADELIEAQKAVGKITIQKNRENAASIINSNDKVIHQMISLEDSMKEAVQSIENAERHNRPEMTDRQQEIIDSLEKNQASMKEELNRMAEMIGSQNHEILGEVRKSVSENAAMLEEHIVSEISVMAEDSFAAPDMAVTEPAELIMPEEPVAAEEITEPKEEPIEELLAKAIAEPKEEPVEEVVTKEISKLKEEPIEEIAAAKEVAELKEDAVEKPAAAKEIAEPKEEAIEISPAVKAIAETKEEAIEIPQAVKEITEPKEKAVEKPAAKKRIAKPKEEKIEKPAAEKKIAKPKKVTVEKPVAAKKAAEPIEDADTAKQPVKIKPQESAESLEEIAASGKIMTPEEIAAMLEEANEEPQEPVKEEPVAVPDLSDPNHVITPEDIAALLANM